MKFYTTKMVKPEELNAKRTLFGGVLLKWIDEEVGIRAMLALNTPHISTKIITQVDFIAPAVEGDIIQIGTKLIAVGRTSITFKCEVKKIFCRWNSEEKNTINVLTIDKIVLVCTDENGKSKPHGIDKERARENLKND